MAGHAALWFVVVLMPNLQFAMHLAREGPRCLDAKHWWYTQLDVKYGLGRFSQLDQDAKLLSLFSDDFLGETNKFFVEFGWNNVGNAQTERLRVERNWTGFRMDNSCGENSQQCHQHVITGDNIVSLFSKYESPKEPDYVSIDIDSIDVWVFGNLTKRFRPRVFTIEYNSWWAMNVTEAGPRQSSLGAVNRAAQESGYSLVGVEPCLDAFVVRSDLVCKGTEVPLSEFAKFTSRRGPHDGTPWTRDKREGCSQGMPGGCPMDWTLRQFPCKEGVDAFCSTRNGVLP